MGLRRKKAETPSMDTPSALALAERANLNKYFTEYRRSRETDFLGEMSLCAEALYVMTEELATRAGAASPITAKPARQIKSSRAY
jgi:hypothetical protein